MNVRQIREKLKITQATLADMCGVTSRTIQNWENGQTIPESMLRLLEKISAEGETISHNSEPNAIPIHPIQANIDNGTLQPHDPEPIPANAEIIPIVPSEVAGEMGIDIRKYVEKNADELDSIDPTKLLKNPDIAEQVAGTSMLPTFAPGDVVFIKFLPDKAKIIDGKTYYFDLKTLPTMIRKVKFEECDRLRLVAKNPAFADIIINRCDILNIGRVIGMFRQTFGDQYDEIEEVRRKKDHQIGKLIDQNTKALEIISDLVGNKN